MKHIEDFGDYFIDYFLEKAEDAVRRDHAGQTHIPNFDNLVEQKMISMIEYVIDNASKNAK